MPLITPEDLPTVEGQNRFWIIDRNPKSETKPVLVELRQRIKGSQINSISERVGFGTCTGTVEDIKKTANLINIRSGQIDLLVGEYEARSSVS